MVKSINKTILPLGIYNAKWCAYQIEIIFENGDKSESFRVNEGIRGMSICTVEVKEDRYVYVIDQTHWIAPYNVVEELNYTFHISQEDMKDLMKKGFDKQEIIENLDLSVSSEIVRMEYYGK